MAVSKLPLMGSTGHALHGTERSFQCRCHDLRERPIRGGGAARWYSHLCGWYELGAPSFPGHSFGRFVRRQLWERSVCGGGLPGIVLTSTDGVEWVSRPTGTQNPLSSVAYGNGQFVVVSEYRDVLSSTDG